jgi:hypothetical protein
MRTSSVVRYLEAYSNALRGSTTISLLKRNIKGGTLG